jgi:hypothetical protein
MASLNKFYAFSENLAEKKYNLGSDQLKVALVNSAPTTGMVALSELTEVSYANCSTRNITTSTSAQTSGTYKLVLTDLTLTASGGTVGPFRYIVIYDSTATSFELIGWYDYGASITLQSGDTFTVDFDGTNGFLQIA